MEFKQPIGVIFNIDSEEETEFNNSNLEMFKFIYMNKTATYIPNEILSKYIGETNFSNQTPLMYAVKINNYNFVEALIDTDIGKLDDNNRSALDYALSYPNTKPEIISLLEEYELG